MLLGRLKSRLYPAFPFSTTGIGSSGSLGVDELADPQDIRFKHTQGVRVRDHQRGHFLGHIPGEGVQVNRPAVVGLDLANSIAADMGARGVGSVGRMGYQDDLPGLSALLEAGPDEHHSYKLSLRSGAGLERAGIHAGGLDQAFLQRLQDLEVALAKLRRSEGGGTEESRESGDLLVDLGVVLHGTGAEGLER